MALAAAVHPFPVFRYLRQAWRDYLADQCVVTVTLPVDVTVAGRVLASGTMIKRGVTSLRATVVKDEAEPRHVLGEKMVPVATNGSWTVTFTGIPAGAAKLKMTCGMQPLVSMETSSPFTVT